MDQHGSLVSKRSGTGSTSSDVGKGDKTISSTSARKHRSLNAGPSSVSSRDGRPRDRRRESLGLSLSGVSKLISSAKNAERHSRQLSAGSTSSSVVDGRRVPATDYSHLPPSPASSSIQHLLKQSTSNRSHTPPPASGIAKDNSASPNVAHSLLRGTQEGWSALDDEATVEALRKLDGLTGKTARARASVGSFGRASSSSRPVTPAKVGNQWEGITSDHGKSKRGSGSEKEGKETLYKHHSVSGPVDTDDNPEGPVDDHLQSVLIQEKTPKKISARMSFTPKRGSTSSTYASTPTTSSRDSASVSTGTSLTSVSGTSSRHSSGKVRRNSAGSDISSSEANLLKDRVASIAIVGDASDGRVVPPVPPLPKDLSSYRSPPPTSGLSFPSFSGGEDSAKRPSHEFNLERTSSLDVHSHIHRTHVQRQGHPHEPGPPVPVPIPLAPKTPSKKWSFSSALNLRLSNSPSSSSKSNFPLSPRAVSFGQQLRKSTSKDKGSSRAPWSPKQPDAMTSAGSLASLSSVGSVHGSSVAATYSAKTPERGLSRSGTGSSESTNNTTSAIPATSSSAHRTQSKRLTPSSIPFFRRSSSQSMQVPPPIVPPSTSPPGHPAASRSKNSTSPSRDFAALSTSVPGSASKKSSVLSLGLPSLLKSSSRRSLHSDAKDSGKESIKAEKEAEKMRARVEKERKKEDKERSESRISLMIRKRGKVSSFSSHFPEQPSINILRLCRQRILGNLGLPWLCRQCKSRLSSRPRRSGSRSSNLQWRLPQPLCPLLLGRHPLLDSQLRLLVLCRNSLIRHFAVATSFPQSLARLLLVP
jgi:dual specificity tyrosine-phosphorylation-regulated kinase 2/3/4